MDYLKSYKIFEEEQKEQEQGVDLKDELSTLGKDLQSKGKQMQDMVLNIAESDPELKKKIDELKNKNKGESESEENEEQSNESLFTFDDTSEEVNEGIALGLALSSGALLELLGKFMGFIGKKFDKEDKLRLQKVGESIEKYGHKIHHKLIGLINTILKPLIFWLPKKKQQTISNMVFMAILAVKISSGSVDPADYQTAGQLAEGLLNTIKAGEIGAFIKDASKGLIEMVKLA